MDSVSLTAEEDEVIMVRSEHREKTLEEWSLSLLGRFHTTELINFRAAENHLSSVWKMEGNDLKITDLRDGVFLFRFSTESQLKWVIDNGPWSFDNHILLLRRWEKGMTASSVNFQTVPMWVQVWELPFDLINEEAGRDIGQGIGRVIEVDCKAIASFLRVRVEVPLDKPIRRGAPVLNPEGDTVRVVFKYERLCGLCFHCGLLGHEAKACKTTKLKVGEESPYGEWLRATEDHGIDGAEAEPLPNFNSGNGHSYHSTTHSSLVEEANPSNTNNEDLITTFCEITSSTREEALFFLESHNFHLDSAVSTFNTNNEDLITTFCEIASSTREEALFFLESHNFHFDSAVSTFLDININPAAVAHPIIPSTVAQSHRDGNPNGHGIDGAETEPQQNFNSGHGHSYHSRKIISEIMEVVECTELKGPHINEEQHWVSNDGKNPEINAIPALQNNMLGKSSSWSELKWLEQKLDYPKLLLSQGFRRLCDAFRMLLTDPTVKERVVSLASDKAFWDVILRNTSLRKFQWTSYAGNFVSPLNSDEEPDLDTRILKWILDATKAKAIELIEKFLYLVNELFQPPETA